MAGWQSGHAAACKAVYAGSIPTPASKSPCALRASGEPKVCTIRLCTLDGFVEHAGRLNFDPTFPSEPKATTVVKKLRTNCEQTFS